MTRFESGIMNTASGSVYVGEIVTPLTSIVGFCRDAIRDTSRRRAGTGNRIMCSPSGVHPYDIQCTPRKPTNRMQGAYEIAVSLLNGMGGGSSV